LEAETVPGRTGQFDVLANGELVFSKAESGRFPEESEVLGLLPG
jgi:selT/selW/selH-like putative selenoprotein